MASVTKEIFIEAPVKTVYEVLTDPDRIKDWMGILGGAANCADDLFKLQLLECMCVQQNYAESHANRKAVFTWAWRKTQRAAAIRSKVEIDLEAKGKGTWVRVTHRELRKVPGRNARTCSRWESDGMSKTIRADRLAQYQKLVATNPEVKLKGSANPYTSLNGNMFTLFDQSEALAIRLPVDVREKFIRKYKTTLFEAHGVVMREYVVVPDSLLAKTRELSKYFLLSYEYAKTLKLKPTKRRARPSRK